MICMLSCPNMQENRPRPPGEMDVFGVEASLQTHVDTAAPKNWNYFSFVSTELHVDVFVHVVYAPTAACSYLTAAVAPTRIKYFAKHIYQEDTCVSQQAALSKLKPCAHVYFSFSAPPAALQLLQLFSGFFVSFFGPFLTQRSSFLEPNRYIKHKSNSLKCCSHSSQHFDGISPHANSVRTELSDC